VLVTQVAIFFEGAIDDVFEFGGEIGIEADGLDRSAMENRFEDLGTGVAAEGKRAGGHLVEDDAEREEIAASVDFLAADLFGRHIGNGANRCAGASEVFLSGAFGGSGVGDGVTAGGE
jgi:hypothetical protein